MALTTTPPISAMFCSISERTSSGTSSLYSPIHPSIVARAELKNVGNSSINSWLCSIVGGITNAMEPAKMPQRQRRSSRLRYFD